MSDQPKKPAWETLAQELGADVTKAPTRPVRPEPPKPAPITQMPAAPATPPAPKKRGWDDLASWLGLGGQKKTRPDAAPTLIAPVLPPPPARTPPPPKVEEPVPVEAQRIEQPRIEPPRTEYRPEPRRESRDEHRRPRRDDRRPEPRDQRRDEPRTESAAPPPPPRVESDAAGSMDRPEGRRPTGPEGEEGEPARRRRRRRRRGGRGRDRDRESPPSSGPAGGESRPTADDDRIEDDRIEERFEGDADQADDMDRAEAVADERAPEGDRGPAPRDANDGTRPRRRRRRGGRGGRDRDGRERGGEPRPTSEPAAAGEEDDVLDVDEESITRERIRAEGLADELDEAHDDEGGEEVHLAHRGIPTWEEAVGMIVNVNLESRAKQPHSSSGHQHRGGRGRGRGGRDRR